MKPEFTFLSKIKMANKCIHISLSQSAIYFILDKCYIKVGRNGYNLYDIAISLCGFHTVPLLSLKIA